MQLTARAREVGMYCLASFVLSSRAIASILTCLVLLLLARPSIAATIGDFCSITDGDLLARDNHAFEMTPRRAGALSCLNMCFEMYRPICGSE